MFLQRPGIYGEEKRILICLGKRSIIIFEDVLKSLLFFVVY